MKKNSWNRSCLTRRKTTRVVNRPHPYNSNSVKGTTLKKQLNKKLETSLKSNVHLDLKLRCCDENFIYLFTSYSN